MSVSRMDMSGASKDSTNDLVPELSYEASAVFGRLIRQINQKLGAGLAFEQILDFIFDSLNLLIPFDRIGIALIEENPELIRLVWVKSKLSVGSLTKNYSASLKGSSLNKIIQTGEPRIINDLIEYLEFHPNSQSTRLILRDGIRASLTCPLRAKNKPVGVVFFSSKDRNTYQDDHVETFLAIADELSVLVEQARLQNYFEQSELNERSFLRILHDLRSPLGIIQSYVDLAREDVWFNELPREAKEVFTVLDKSAKNMSILLEELNQLKEIRSSAATLEKREVLVDEFLSDVISFSRGFAQRKGIEFETFVDPYLPKFAIFDRLKIQRVLDNLISNAIKYSWRGSKILLSVMVESNRLYFSIKDSGLGIKEEEIPKLFKEFSKTSTRPTEDESSTGLGLVICKEIVQRHGGEIYVQSKIGEGSTFSFWIPLERAQSLH